MGLRSFAAAHYTRVVSQDVRAESTALVAIADVSKAAFAEVFSARERAYAASKSDPERRLAARLAAKQAALAALGGGLELRDVEIVRGRGGPPRLELSERGRARLAEIGGDRMLVSLTHGREHAAAAVLVLGGPRR
jgi:holo-[acyl-carrier protein] synthase